MQFDDSAASTLHDILRWRRDVRHFRTDAIPEPLIDALADAMALAPSVGNSRPWRVMRVRSATRRAAVTEVFARCNAAAAELYDDTERDTYLGLKLAGIRDAPEHLAVFCVSDPMEGRSLGRQTMDETLAYSAAMAIHTLWLAARAINLGVGWVSILDPDEVCAILDAPRGWRFIGYLCLGYSASNDDTPLLHRAGWQENTKVSWIMR
jgi:5,6-dimethylbenzimidazole synthase